MKKEITDVLGNLAKAVIDSTGGMIKGESVDTIESIITRNVDVALLKLNMVLTTSKYSILTKAKAKKDINVNALSSILNEEL
jgi:hypothetical protein